MCSHRGRLAVEGVAPGSLTAYSVLFKVGGLGQEPSWVERAGGLPAVFAYTS